MSSIKAAVYESELFGAAAPDVTLSRPLRKLSGATTLGGHSEHTISGSGRLYDRGERFRV